MLNRLFVVFGLEFLFKRFHVDAARRNRGREK